MDKVSVIVPTYNRFHYLLNTIKSIKEQTYKNIEIIVVNDCSTQKEYYEHEWKDIKIIHLDVNSKCLFGFACPGGYQRNFGIKQSTGKYLAFCDDDDIWFPTKIEKQLLEMKKTNCKLSCTEAYIGNGTYRSTDNYPCYLSQYSKNWISHMYETKSNINIDNGLPNIWDLSFLQINNCIICSSVVIENTIIDNTGEFIIANTSEDYDYWLRALQHTNCVFLNEPLVYYDAGHGDGQNYSK